MCSAGTIMDGNKKIEANRALRSSMRKSLNLKRSGILGLKGAFNKSKYSIKTRKELAGVRNEIASIRLNDNLRGISYAILTSLVLSIGVYTFINVMIR